MAGSMVQFLPGAPSICYSIPMQNTLNIILGVIVLILLGWMMLKPDNATQLQTNTQKETTSMSPNPTASVKAGKQYKQAGQATTAGKAYTALLKTSAGDITIQLSKDTPKTTNNFVFLAKDGFYDGVIFHRTIPGFMIQGGDPTGTGSGGPGYRFEDEEFRGEYKRGVLAMANAGPDTNGSQFFIMHADYPLPPNYVIFGMVTKGLEVVDKIASAPTVKDGRENSRPQTPVTITTVEITEE